MQNLQSGAININIPLLEPSWLTSVPVIAMLFLQTNTLHFNII
jgi:hypothetical protein